MERVLKLALRNFLIYILVFIMAITPGINDETISLLHDVVAYATSGGFDHSNPTSAAAGIISSPCYDNPPVLIYINNDKETVLKGTDGWTEFLNFWAGKHPNLDDIRPENSLIMVSNAGAYTSRMQLMNKTNENLFVSFYKPDNRTMTPIETATNCIKGEWGAGNWVKALQQSHGQNASPTEVNPIFYKTMTETYTSSNIKDNWRNLLSDSGAVQLARTTWANIILGVHNTKTGLTHEFYNHAFNPENLDLGNMDAWSDTQKESYWWHYLDALVSLYAASQGSTFQDELGRAIDKYVAGEGLDVSPVSITLVQMTCLVMDSHLRSEYFIITPAIHFVEFACGVTASNVIDGTPWRSADHSAMLHTRWLDGGTANSSSTDSIIANVVNNSIIEAKDFPRSESMTHDKKKGFSWGLTAICYNGIMTKPNPNQDGNDVYFNTGAVKTAYIRLLGLSDPTGANAWISGFTIWPMPTCKTSPPIGRLVAIPDNKYISTKTIPDNVTLTLYGGAQKEDLSFWSGVVAGAKAANANFTVTVRWSQHSDVIYGLGQGSFMMPVQTFVWSPDEFYRWITDASPITNMDITYGKQYATGNEHLPIDYTADITVQLSTGSTYTGTPTDDASWELETEGIKYTSTPQAYVELKNYGVDSDMVGNLSEDFEAMAGVPSTEQLYFAAGGSEFIVDITVNETADEIAYRTYDYYYTQTECEYYTGDQTPTYTVPSYNGILKTSSDYTLNPHTGDLTVSVTISGTIHNDASDVTALHEATCVAKPNASDVANRISAYQSLVNWYNTVGAYTISKTAASDKKTRTGTIQSLCTGSLPSMPTGVPKTTHDSQPCSASDGPPPTPCGNEMATAVKGADVPWSVTASWTIPAHQLCGPCCRHILPEVHDTWTQTTQYDSMEINNVHVWRIDQAAIDGLEEIINVDLVNADVVRGLPNIFYNIALKNIPTYKSKDNGPDNGLAKGSNMATRTAEAGRLIYSYERDQVDTVDVNLGTRTNKCDGLAHTESYNIIYAGGNGHKETNWDTHHSFIYTTSSESFDTSLSGNSKHGETGCKINPRTSKTWGMEGKNWVEEHTDDDDKKSAEYTVFKQKRDDKNQSTMVTDFLILQTSSGDQSVMYYQQSAPAAVACDAIMGNIDASNASLADIESASATDGLINAVINQTNNGTTTTVGGAHINTVNGVAAGALSGGPISSRYWYNNPLSASGWDVYHIGLGSYTGKYWLPESKFNGTSGGASVNTLFDDGNHGSRVMGRPARVHKLMLYAGELNIKLDNTNQSYVTGYSEVFWSNQLHWNNRAYTRINMAQNGLYKPYENIDPTDFNTTTKYPTTEIMFDRNPDGTWKGNGEGQTSFYFASGRNQKGNAGVSQQETIRSKYQFGIDDYKVDGGYVLEGVYSDSTVGGSEFEKCNDIIVHDPVSTQDIALVPLPDYRDQRTNERTGGAVDVVNKINENIKCPEDPGLCEFRTLHCTFFEDHVVFNTTFTPDASGMFVNTVTGNSLALTPGFTLDRNNSFGSGQYALNANGTRLSIPFSEMDVTYSTGTKIRVEADVIMTSTGKPQMLFSFNKYAIYLPASNELGLNENRCLNITTGTDAGWEKKVNIPVADGKKHHIAVDFSFNKVTGTKVSIDGVESGYTILKTSNDINSSLVGSTLNIGSWNVNDLYGANFWIDNLKVTRLAGTNKHTDECYTIYMTHKDGLNAHNHTAACIQGIEYDVDQLFSYTGGVQQFKASQEGDYLLEVWGAQGGGDSNQNAASHAGLGGYSKGTLHLKAGQTVYVYVGGAGAKANAMGQGGGYNGGGQGGPNGYGGGGMTHISTTQNVAQTSVTSREVDSGSSSGSQSFGYTGGVQSFIAPVAGNYTLEVWGASGGGWGNHGHTPGGYSKGTIYLTKGQTIYIECGGAGNCASDRSEAHVGRGSGWNGGAGSSSYGRSGGATSITTTNRGELRNFSSNRDEVLIVAGGGGSNGYWGSVGRGGGLTGEGAADTHNGTNISYSLGATQTGSGSAGNKGGFGYGGVGTRDGGSGGGGWYGGSGASNHYAGGGGGSGYIGGVTNGTTTTGGGNRGDGTAKISWSINNKKTVYDANGSWNPAGTIIVAGGGGGSDDAGGVLRGDNDGSGGSGGGTNGGNAFINGAASGGTGSTQNSGYKQGAGESVTVVTDAGGAGGGWYGGKTPNHYNGGGGGGSGYIGKVTNGTTQNGVNAGNGKARISKQGNVMGALLEGKLTEDEKKKYFGDAYPYITGLNDLTTLYTYANWYNSNNGFFNLAAENVVSNADGSFTIDSVCGWEAGSNVDIELNALQSIEITYRKGEKPKTDTGIAFVTKSGISREIWGTYSTNENGETVAKIVIPMDMRTGNATAIWYDLGGYMAGGTCTVKSIKILGYGTSKTETKTVTVSSANTHGVYTYKTNGFGNSKYDVEIVGASGGDGRIVNQTTIAKNSGGMGAVVRGTTQFAGNTNLMFTVGGKGGDQTSTAVETYGTYNKVAELRSAGKGTFTFKAGKQYKVVMYGAAGGGGRIGTGESHGGYGGVTTGMVKFDKDTKAYYYTGGKGSYAQYIGYGGGYNGGGHGGPGGYGGGGMTYLSLNDNGQATSKLRAVESVAGTNIYSKTQANIQINTWYTMSTFTCQSHGQQSLRLSCDNNHITYIRLLDQTDGNKEIWKSDSMHGDGSTLQNGGKYYGPGNTCYREFNATLTEGHIYVVQLYSTCGSIKGQSATTQCKTTGGYVNTYVNEVSQWSTDGIIMVAGGGGGADNADFQNSVAGGQDDGSGGNGGGTRGGNACINGKDSVATDNTGAGGTQTSGFGRGVGESAVTKTDTGGAGAGWYGGRTTENYNGGAGGGSGYFDGNIVYSAGEVIAQTAESNNTGDGIIEIYEVISVSEPKDSAGGFNGGGVGAREFNEEFPESAAGGGGMTDLRTFSTGNGERETYYGANIINGGDNRATANGTSATIASNNTNYNLYQGGNIARTAGQMYEVVWEGYGFSHANFSIDYGIYITDQNDSTYNQFHHMRGANLLGYSVTDTRITAIYQITETSRITEFRLELASGTIVVDKKTITNMGSASDYLAVAGGGGGAGSHMNDAIARGENATVINGDGTLVVPAHSGLLQNGTQSDGYKKGLGQPGVNGDRQNNYGAIAGSGAGYFGGKVVGKNTTGYAVGGAGGSSYIDKSFETNADKVTGLLRTSNGDGAYKLDEYRMTLIIKGSNYNDNAYMDKLQQYYTLIPDTLPDGSPNPIWSNCTKTPNYHKCNNNCAVAKVLTCSEPHHNNLHYDVSSRVCWEPCHNDENHRLQNKNIQLGDTSFTPGNFINIDYGFTIFFPNRGNFYEGEQYGVGSLLTAKGLGFRNIYQTDNPYRSGPYNGGTKYSDDYVWQKVGMSTSKWTRVKRIKFNLNVIYKGKLYLSGEWITLGDRGTYEGQIGGIGNKIEEGKYSETKWSNYNTELYNDLYADYYTFYAVLDNEEARASKYMVEVTAVNCKNFDRSGNGQVNDNTQDIKNDERGKSYAAKHGGHNEGYFDVVGRIGNLLMEDTEDFRFSNLFKQTVTSESTKITPKTYLVNNGLGTKDSKDTENGAETNKNYVITNESGQYAVVKGVNVTNKFYKIVVSGKGLKAGRVAIVDANTGDEISSDLLSVIQESSQKVSYYVDLSNESLTKADLKIISKSANVMAVYSIEWAELGSSPDKWLLEGIVREVDETKQNVYLSWVADIRGIKVSKDTHYLDTWGTLTWMNGNRIDLPLSPEKNNIDILKDEPLLTGYAALMDIQTIGSYWQNDTTQLQIIPKYVALNTDNGTMKKLDVYMEHEGAYVPLNYYNNVKKDGSNQAIIKQVYDNILNLDWVNTKDRRNVSTLEDAKTQAVYENSLTSTVVDESGLEGDPEDGDTNYRPIDVPGGHIYTLGNNQYMRLTGEARTFVGGTSTYGDFKNLGNRLSEVFWYRSAQRWHFLVGVPSSAVFVESGKPVTDDNINEIKEGPYVLACALNITAVGNVWALQYKHRYSGATLANYNDYKHNIINKNTDPGRGTPWTDIGKSDGAYIGKVTIPNSNGNSVTIDLNKFGHELDYDPIVLVFSASKDSSQDIEVVGTH